MTRLYITIGPVQSFVAQARRTRDLWSGSFLLSYLSGHAMIEARKAGGKILVPDIENDNLIGMINGKGITKIGSLPNAFEVDPDGNDPEDIAKASEKAFRDAWKKIANAVWDKYLSEVEGNGTRDIWDRQVENFWEFNWAVGEGHGVIDARKNWRRQDIPVEGGDHCTLMGDFQELSGYVRYKNRKEQDSFWEHVRKKASELDLKKDERLCAIAFIKRFFSKVTKDAIGKKLDIENWPSTVYMAAVPWLKRTNGSGMEDKLEEYFQLVKENGKNIYRPGISELLDLGIENKYANIDGNFYFKELVLNESQTPMKEGADRKRISGIIENIQREMGVCTSPYYALLLMDGDSMGDLKRDYPKRILDISKALSSFSRNVGNVVRKYNGVAIYAGGDDVLAMLPTDGAIPCAHELSKNFSEAFKGIGMEATISAGVVITHYHQPLLSVYNEAKHLLEDVAKDENGRNSIGVSVLKNSGKYLQWVSTWNADGEDVVKTLQEAVEKHQGFDKSFSSSLMYSMRDSLSVLADIQNWVPGKVMELSKIDDLNIENLIISEMVRSREKTMDVDEAKRIIDPILFLCSPHTKWGTDEKKFSIDGWFLVNFLAKHLVEVKK